MTVDWSPKDDYILASGGTDHTVRIWDIRKARSCLMTLDQFNNSHSKVYNNSSQHLSTPYKLPNPSKTAALSTSASTHTGPVNGVKFTSDGMFLVTTGHDETIRLWNAKDGTNQLVHYGTQLLNKSPSSTVLPALTCVSSPHSSLSSLSAWPPLLLHPSDDRSILMYDLFSGKCIKQLKGGHFSRVGCVVVHPFSQRVFSGGHDHEILVWDPASDDKFPKTNSLHYLHCDTWSDDEDMGFV